MPDQREGVLVLTMWREAERELTAVDGTEVDRAEELTAVDGIDCATSINGDRAGRIAPSTRPAGDVDQHILNGPYKRVRAGGFDGRVRAFRPCQP